MRLAVFQYFQNRIRFCVAQIHVHVVYFGIVVTLGVYFKSSLFTLILVGGKLSSLPKL